MSKLSTKELDKLAEKVEQASRQPINNPNSTESSRTAFMTSIKQWSRKAELEEPPYIPNSSVRDAWLRDFVKAEPHLAGVLSTAVSLDTNRGYSLIGGRNQVVRFSRVLRGVENGQGWRQLKQLGCQDYYSTDMGQVVEVETDGRNGPLVSLYHVDSTRCELTGNLKNPLVYKPSNGKEQIWKQDYFYRICSMPSPDERFFNLGYCPVSRCLKITQIMIAVIEHDLEKLNTLLPKGILTVESDEITQEMWDNAWNEHLQVYPGQTGNLYFDRLITLVARAIKVNLTPFSELPDGFDPFTFTDYMLKAYALCFNRDPRAFWGFNSGSFGGGTESAVQAERATNAGYIDYLLQDQEQIQNLLPPSILFQYEEDDTQGKIQKAELLNLWADAGLKLVELGIPQSSVLALMVKEQIIDPEFTPEIESEIATDDENVLQYRRQQLLEKEHVQMAVSRFPDDPIIEYRFPDNRLITLWDKGSQAIKKYHQFSWTTKRIPKGSRQQSKLVKQQVNFDKFGQIVEKGMNKEIDKDELKERLTTYQLAGMVVSFLTESTTNENRTSLEQSVLDNAIGYMDNPALLDNDSILNDSTANEQKDGFNLELLALILPTLAYDKLIEKYEFGQDSDFFEQIESGYFEDVPEGTIDYRVGLWESAMGLILTYGFLFMRGGEDDLLIWVRTASDSCETCIGMEGTIKTRGEWQESNVLPATNTNCGAWCLCYLSEL